MRACTWTIPVGYIAVTAGWITTEAGRQPWVVYGHLRTADAVTPSLTAGDVLISLVVYAAVLLPRLLEGYDVWDPAFGVLMGAGVIGTALLLIKTAAFPETAWTDPEWLRETADALIIRPTTAQLPIWGLLVVVVYAWWRGRRTTPRCVPSCRKPAG